MLTGWDVLDAATVAALLTLALAGWLCGKPLAATSMVLGLALFHVAARQAIGGHLGNPYLALAALALFNAFAHLWFEYSGPGLAAGLAYCAIAGLSGAALAGWIPAPLHQGPGLDYWTAVSLAAWAIAAAIGYGIAREHRRRWTRLR